MIQNKFSSWLQLGILCAICVLIGYTFLFGMLELSYAAATQVGTETSSNAKPKKVPHATPFTFFSNSKNEDVTPGQLLTTFQLQGTPNEIKGLMHNASVIPTIGEQGSVVVKGDGAVSFEPFRGERGLSFSKGAQQNTNVGYLNFTINGIETDLDPYDGEIEFYLKSKYSLAERAAIPAYNFRKVFSIRNGKLYPQPYSFLIETTGGSQARLMFTYTTASTQGTTYYFPMGTENEIFGKDKIAKIKLTWKGNKNQLYINDVLVKESTFKPLAATWIPQLELTLGADAGYFASDDAIADFKISLRGKGNSDVAGTTIAPATTAPVTTSKPGTTTSTTSQTSKPVVNTPTSTPVGITSSTTKPVSTKNEIIISNKSGSVLTHYPVQVGRAFKIGEIRNFPQAVVNGIELLTQADVKQRWSDGSVKHAVVSFVIENMPAKGDLVVTFKDQSSMNNTAMTPTEMLHSTYDFDAEIDLGKLGKASAREMIVNGDYTIWNSGPVNTTILLRDNSVDRMYDLGADAYKSFRPSFEVTFWKGINKVRVRYIGEITNTEYLQDLTYDITLRLGNSTKTVVYTKPAFTHYVATRWTKVFWLGGAPDERVNIDHNIGYIKDTKFLPNYDASIRIPESQIAASYALWQKKNRDIGEAGFWQKAMPTTGGRPDIGPFPTWAVQWLYTGDWRSREIALGSSDLASSWPMHFREGNATKFFDEQKKIPGIGKPISIKDRPTIFLGDGNYYMLTYYNKKDDIVKIVGAYDKKSNGWSYDSAHVPEASAPQYLLTGEYWYLEQMEFWNAALAAGPNSGSAPWGRGPTGKEGGIAGQIRGEGWVLRSRVELAHLEPDGRFEKKYWEHMINDAIAIWEGGRNIKGTSFENTPQWKWGNTVEVKGFGTAGTPVAPIYAWAGVTGGSYLKQAHMKEPVTTKGALAPWMQNMIIYALGRGQELGYKTDALLGFVGQSIVGQLSDPEYNPYLVSLYTLPSLNESEQWYTSWKDVKAQYVENIDYKDRFQKSMADTEHGYGVIARTAAAMAAQLPNGNAAWGWMNKNTDNTYFVKNPKWAIIPR
jgi:hypothetical protein